MPDKNKCTKTSETTCDNLMLMTMTNCVPDVRSLNRHRQKYDAMNKTTCNNMLGIAIECSMNV